jgi:hypothetical protein
MFVISLFDRMWRVMGVTGNAENHKQFNGVEFSVLSKGWFAGYMG